MARKNKFFTCTFLKYTLKDLIVFLENPFYLKQN